MQVTIFTANCIGQAANCSYPNKVTVVTPEQLQEAVKADHVCAEYKGNYRGIGNFIRSDVIVMDIDNDHSEEPTEWITAEKLEEIFPDMNICLLPVDIICFQRRASQPDRDITSIFLFQRLQMQKCTGI